MAGPERIDIDAPRWDQSTFIGRVKHFACITDYRTCFVSEAKLDEAKLLLQQYRVRQEPPGTTEEQIWYAKKLYESSFHPDTGDKNNLIGRMSFQVPGGMTITGGMLAFYKTVPAIVFWQWINQSFNALVNYTNRNAQSDLTNTRIAVAYVSATTSALVTAIGVKRFLERVSTPLLLRYVPFTAVAAANCVNIPLMRQTELSDGITLSDENGNNLTESKIAAAKGISQVIFSRIAMAAPGMLALPIIMQRMEKLRIFQTNKFVNPLFQTLMCGVSLTFMVPIACAIFPQKCSIRTDTLKRFEPEKFEKLKAALSGKEVPEKLYFNKGL